ncbi:MAG TPA: DNA-binding domain-containing protein [Usitatibacter sp.]|nr:DNA-binding domain-containing protein [Usitatibacter sp.]
MTLARAQSEFLRTLLGEGEPPDAGAQVYRRNILANAVGALEASYPVVRRLVGESFFREAAVRYALAVPSTSGDLNERGAAFAGFLARYPHAAGLPYLADVARLEWAVHECERAAEEPSLNPSALGAVSPEAHGAIRLQLHPSVRMLASAHPVLAIWQANQHGRDGVLDANPGAERVCVRRVAGAVIPFAVGESEWTLLVAFGGGATLDAACASLGAAAEEEFGPALLHLAAAEVFSSFEAPRQP